MLELYIDTDACPVKQEICKVAKRYHLSVTFVANSWMRISDQEGVRLVVVGDQFDAADQWIVDHVSKDDIVITADIPLASLCVKAGAGVPELPDGLTWRRWVWLSFWPVLGRLWKRGNP